MVVWWWMCITKFCWLCEHPNKQTWSWLRKTHPRICVNVITHGVRKHFAVCDVRPRICNMTYTIHVDRVHNSQCTRLRSRINDMTPLHQRNVRTTAGVVTLIVTGYIYIIISCPLTYKRKKSTAKKIFTIYVLNTCACAVVKKFRGVGCGVNIWLWPWKKIGGTNSRTCAIWYGVWIRRQHGYRAVYECIMIDARSWNRVVYKSTLPEEENYIYKYTHLLHVMWEC